MISRPILFNTEMIRAVLADIKRMTRRLNGLEKLNEGYYRDRIGTVECRDGLWCFWEIGHGSSALPVFTAKCPFGSVGDQLWVKETWQDYCPLWGGGWCGHGTQDGIIREHLPVYFADPPELHLRDMRIEDHDYGDSPPKPAAPLKWRPSIHMPRWASRITLEITGVRVERVQDISEEDAIAEGIELLEGGYNRDFSGMWKNYDTEAPEPYWNSPRDSFHSLWESINGPGSWEKNPFVWVISFRRVDK